jgi:hypothetical protein
VLYSKKQANSIVMKSLIQNNLWNPNQENGRAVEGQWKGKEYVGDTHSLTTSLTIYHNNFLLLLLLLLFIY